MVWCSDTGMRVGEFVLGGECYSGALGNIKSVVRSVWFASDLGVGCWCRTGPFHSSVRRCNRPAVPPLCQVEGPWFNFAGKGIDSGVCERAKEERGCRENSARKGGGPTRLDGAWFVYLLLF